MAQLWADLTDVIWAGVVAGSMLDLMVVVYLKIVSRAYLKDC